MAVASVELIGGNGGCYFSHGIGTDGRLLQKIGVWAAESRIKALKVWLTNDDSRVFGDTTNPDGEGPLRSKEFAFKPNELITELSLWGNGIGTRAGWIYFKTSHGRSFDFGMYDWPKKTKYPIDVASGLCVGVRGKAGSDIDCLGFAFLKPIASLKIVNVKYPTLSSTTGGLQNQTLREFNDINTSSQSRTWVFESSATLTVSSAWSATDGLSATAKVTVEGQVPLVGKVGGELAWELSKSKTSEQSSTTTDTVTWRESGTLNPGQSIHLRALITKGVISVPYTAATEVVLKSGDRFKYDLSGQYSGVAFSAVTVTDA